MRPKKEVKEAVAEAKRKLRRSATPAVLVNKDILQAWMRTEHREVPGDQGRVVKCFALGERIRDMLHKIPDDFSTLNALIERAKLISLPEFFRGLKEKLSERLLQNPIQESEILDALFYYGSENAWCLPSLTCSAFPVGGTRARFPASSSRCE